MNESLLLEATYEWAPDYPIRATYSDDGKQTVIDGRLELLDSLVAAANKGGPGYVSSYSYPRGHSHDGNIPKVNTLFLDFDIPKSFGNYDPKNGGRIEDWRRDMSALLTRAQMVADVILDSNKSDFFRVSLSGHKGLHLFIDFDPLDPGIAGIEKFKNGLNDYANELIGMLNDEAGGIELQEWVDVNSSDLGRLVRHPNTPHNGAEHVAWTPYCVPVTLEELSEMDADDYLDLTKQPRELPDGATRTPSSKASEKITEHIKNASSERSVSGAGKSFDKNAVAEYRKQANEKITVDDIPLLVKEKPCIEAFVNRDDAYDYDSQSRIMEINAIKQIMQHNVPIEVIIEYFSDIPGFSEDYTEELVKDIIGRYDGPLVCQNICDQASEFCLGDKCGVYRRHDDLDRN